MPKAKGKTNGDPICQLIALTPNQMAGLYSLYEQKYQGKCQITCGGCLQSQERVINGDPSEGERLRIASGEHNKSPTTCLQAFWRLSVATKKMCKNGNLGKKAEVSLLEVEMAEKSMSRATTAPGTPGTPFYDPGDGEDAEVPDTQEGESSSPAKTAKQLASAAPRKAAPKVDPKAAIEDEIEDEDSDDMLLDEEPKKKRGRGRPPGVKNRVTKKEKERLIRLLKGTQSNLVAETDIQSVALIPERHFRLGR